MTTEGDTVIVMCVNYFYVVLKVSVRGILGGSDLDLEGCCLVGCGLDIMTLVSSNLQHKHGWKLHHQLSKQHVLL